MKKLAARDFEDLLQCALPCFDGLLPAAFNRKLQNLLYRTAEWHAAAKLRMHTDATLVLLDELTREFGKLAREFEELSAVEFKTVETPKEATARARRALTKTAAAAGRPAPTNSEVAAAPKGRKPKRLNLCTYKFHALGDYVQTIKTYGTTDSYSTQMARTPRTYACIDLTHACRLYQLTNKKDAMVQVAKKYERVDFFRQAEKFEMKDLAKASLKKPYVISDSTNDHFDMPSFIQKHKDDPACDDFARKLRDHLLGRRLGKEFDGDDHDFTDEERATIQIRNQRIYRSQLLRVNYTTYDVRRDYDCISARRRQFVMTRSPEQEEGAHPYWHAQVLGVFRADVRHTGLASKDFKWHPMDFLWVRWLGSEPNYRWGRHVARLPKVGFVPEDHPDAFGFLDPALVIRGAHLIPSFTDGRGVDCLREGPSLARTEGVTDDWVNYYVNIFPDRDMWMRHLGGGVGHLHWSPPRADAGYESAATGDDGAEVTADESSINGELPEQSYLDELIRADEDDIPPHLLEDDDDNDEEAEEIEEEEDADVESDGSEDEQDGEGDDGYQI
ncbi:hypothetical protein FB107DRAFT_276230 [Schizophyllum commune]